MSSKGKRRSSVSEPRTKRARTAEPTSPPPSALPASTSALDSTPSSASATRRRRGASVAPPSGKGGHGLLARLANAAKPPLNSLTETPLPRMDEREVYVWGDGSLGQFGLGLGDLTVKASPARHGRLGARLESVACGGMHCLAIDEEGEVWSWGINDAGGAPHHRNASFWSCSQHSTRSRYETRRCKYGRAREYTGKGASIFATLTFFIGPDAQVEGLDDIRAVKIAAGASISLALGSRGELRVWGSFRARCILYARHRPLTLPELARHPIAQVACGADHVLALSTTGIVFVWGNGQQNQLGRKVIERRKTAGLTPERLALKNIVLVAAGAWTSYAVDSFGRCFAWGLNASRQTGVSDDYGGGAVVVPSPTHITALDPAKLGARVVAIRGGDHHALFLLGNGSLLACGRADASQTGLPRSHPARIDSRRHIAERQQQGLTVAAAECKRMTANGKKRAEAERESTRLAEEQVFVPLECVTEPTRLDLGVRIRSIACGPQHSLAVDVEGRCYAWGFCSAGGLGLGEGIDEVEVPTEVKGFRVSEVAVGGSCTFALS